MDIIDIALGIALAMISIAYIAYGLIMLKQASRFYKVSKRTVFSSIFFVCSSVAIFTVLIIAYIGSVTN